MGKKRIIYIHQDGLITGSAISLRHFLSAISRDKYEPVVVLAEEGPARQLYEDLGIEVHVQPYHRFWTFPGPNWYSPNSFKQFKALKHDKALAAFIKQLNPDIIHINDKAAMNAGISTKQLGKPIVQHSRSSFSITASPLNKWLGARAMKKYSSCIIAISEDEIDGFEGFKNLVIINNTVDMQLAAMAVEKREETRRQLGILPHETAIGMVGAISAKKGAWNFLDMAAQMVKKYPQAAFKFLMVGKAPTSGNVILNDGKAVQQSTTEYINAFAKNNGLSDKLVVTGFRKDALEVMAALDVLIVANTNGVMGRQPIEAQALGVPVVVAQGNNGSSTILVNNQGGIVISSPVNISELTAAVEKLVNNPQIRAQMGANGKQYAAEKFNPAINMGLIEKIYDQLLHKN